MHRALTLAVLLTLATGCPRPPDAPTELDDLCGYLFVHHPDVEDMEMAAGLVNLGAWLDGHWEETADGLVVDGLSDETVDSLDGVDRSVEEILGVAVATRSEHAVDAAASALLEVDQQEVEPDWYETFDRTFLTDLDCFMARECLRLETLEMMEVNLAMGIKSTNETYNQYLWVLIDGDWALVQRSWLVEQPEDNSPLLEVYDQYYLNAFVPRSGGHYRQQSTWLVADQSLLGEDGTLYMVALGMEVHAENLEAYLDGN